MTDLQLKCFVAGAKLKNFSKAAKAIFVSQATVSRQIETLEREMGCRLFDRTTRDLKMTPAGEAFIKHAETALGALDDGITEAREIEGSYSEISIGCLRNTRANGVLSKMLDQFCDTNPYVRISRLRGNEKELVYGLNTGGFDAILVMKHIYRKTPEDNEILVTYLDAGVVIHKRNPLFLQEHIGIDDIRQLEFIRYDPFGIPLQDDYLYNVCKEKGFTPNVVCHRDNFEEFLFDMEMGNGAAIMLEDQTLSSNDMLRFVTLKERIRVPLYMTFRKNNACGGVLKLYDYLQQKNVKR